MSTPSSGRGGRRPSKTVVLKLPSARLTQFPHDDKPSAAPAVAPAAAKPPPAAAGSKASSQSPSTPSALGKESPLQPQQQQQQTDATDEVKTETPNDTSSNLQVPAEGKKRGGARAGGPRRGLGPDGLPKPRGKPGPKRRKLLDANGNVEDSGKPWSTTAAAGGLKLGPKANQGAINAGLRALDRTGAPCRRWAKRGFSVKSFTGIVWELPSWSAPKREEKDEGEDEGENAEGDDRPPPESSNVGSEVPNKEVNGATDSPAPMVVEATA